MQRPTLFYKISDECRIKHKKWFSFANAWILIILVEWMCLAAIARAFKLSFLCRGYGQDKCLVLAGGGGAMHDSDIPLDLRPSALSSSQHRLLSSSAAGCSYWHSRYSRRLLCPPCFGAIIVVPQ
jgi:hypothetical protein